MVTRLSQDFVNQIKNNIDIVDVISDYVQLKKTGKNYKGLCPFHQEKTPSFTVNPVNQFYHCFGCGAGGDVLNFLMEIEHITFQESLKMLAERAGLELPEQGFRPTKGSRERELIFKINKLAAKFYHYLLTELKVGNEAVKYLNQRGFNSQDIDMFFLGYAPDRWDALLKFLLDKGFSKDQLLQAGLVLKNKQGSFYDRFRGRVIFPIFNARGEVLAFGGRIITQNNSAPKYLNSPDTPIYNKGEHLYGLNWAKIMMRQTDSAVIMEGYTDVLTAHQAGIKNAVASLGTALTEEQARLLNRYVSAVYIAYDADFAGAKATIRGLDILSEQGLQVKVIQLPEEMDPDEFIKANGGEALRLLEKQALSLVDFKIKQIIADRDYTRADEKVAISRDLISLISSLEDAIEREIYLKKIAKLLELDTDLLKSEINRIKRKDLKKKDKNYKNSYTKNVNKTNIPKRIITLERRILQAFISYPEYKNMIIDKIRPDMFSSENNNLAELLWENKAGEVDDIFNQLDNKQLKSQLMALTVEESENITENMLVKLLTRFKESYLQRKKLEIYKKLQKQDDISLDRLNELLISFQLLAGDPGKEGF